MLYVTVKISDLSKHSSKKTHNIKRGSYSNFFQHRLCQWAAKLCFYIKKQNLKTNKRAIDFCICVWFLSFCNELQWSLGYPGCIYPETPLSGQFFSGMKKCNVFLLHLAGNLCFRNRTVVWGTKPCFTMTKGPCYPDTRQSVIDFKANRLLNTASHNRAWLATR